MAARPRPSFLVRPQLRFWLLASLLVAALARPASAAPKYPPYDTWVMDVAHALDDGARQHLHDVCQRLDLSGAAQLAVALVPSDYLDDETPSAYANELFSRWKLGKKGKDNGLLVLFVPTGGAHGRLWIEVGYGLEGALPDGKVGALRDEFRRSMQARPQLGAAVSQLVDGLAAVAEAEAGTASSVGPGTTQRRPAGRVHREAVPLSSAELGGLAAVLASLGIILTLLAISALRHQFPGRGLALTSAALGAAGTIAAFLSSTPAAWLALVVGAIAVAMAWLGIQAHKCPKEGSWLHIDEEVIEHPTEWSEGLARVTKVCTSPSCRYRSSETKTLPRRQRTVVVSGGGGGFGDSSSGSDGFSGGGGGSSGGGGAGGDY